LGLSPKSFKTQKCGGKIKNQVWKKTKQYQQGSKADLTPFFFSSMKSRKELGRIIEIANREPDFESKAEKFLSLIRK
jgi:hypothetical protein